MGKLPSTQWYFADWLRDPALRGVSLAARGLWADMLAMMWEYPERGYSPYIGTRKAEAKAWAKVVGHRADYVEKLLRELEIMKVFSRRESDHRIYSRRMVREELERERWRESKRRNSTRFPGDFPPISTDVPGALSSSSSSSSSKLNTTPPYPPASGGNPTHDDLLKDEKSYCYMPWDGQHIIIKTGNRKRILTEGDRQNLVGARIEQVLQMIRRRGFWAEIYVPSEPAKATME